MMVDTRPTARVTFKKNLMNQYVQTTNSLERRFTAFINNDLQRTKSNIRC